MGEENGRETYFYFSVPTWGAGRSWPGLLSVHWKGVHFSSFPSVVVVGLFWRLEMVPVDVVWC